MGTKRGKATAQLDERPGATPEDLPERWSIQRKTELVLRLLRGEPVDGVSRESHVPAHELERWRRVFLETGARGLKGWRWGPRAVLVGKLQTWGLAADGEAGLARA